MKIQTLSIFTILIFQSFFSFAQSGMLDPDFGNNGLVTFDIENLDEGKKVVVQPDGKILITGRLGGSLNSEKIGIIRLNENGSLDSTFSNNGYWTNSSLTLEGTGIDIAVQPDGKILLLANATDIANQQKTIITRLNSNGRLDQVFGNFGSEELDAGGVAMALQSNGKIVIFLNVGTEINLVRLDQFGTKDPFFGDNGLASVNTFDLGSFRGDIAIQKDDKIVVTTGILDNDTDIFLARFEREGQLDSRFGNSGRVRTDIAGRDEFGRSLLIDSNDKILVGGGTTTFFGGRDFSIVRYDSDGDKDLSFGDFGVATTDFSRGSETNHSIALQEDGKIVAAGFIGVRPNHDFALVRYNTDGSIDQSFGDAGKVTTDFGADDLAYSVAIQPDHKIVALGHTLTNTTRGDFAVARYFSGLETVDANDLEIKNRVELSPNPTSGFLKIESDLEVISSSIFNTSGQLIFQTNETEFDISNLNAGFYFLKMQIGDFFLVRKVIKE